MQKNQSTIYWVIALVLVGGIMFFAGSKSAGTKTRSQDPNAPQNFGQNGGRRGGAMNGRGGMVGGFNGGEILSKDDKSVTIKMRDGGSKIIFFTTSTKVLKSSEGSLNDLVVGENISTNGQQNPDGSISASSIQLRPDFATSSPAAK